MGESESGSWALRDGSILIKSANSISVHIVSQLYILWIIVVPSYLTLLVEEKTMVAVEVAQVT